RPSSWRCFPCFAPIRDGFRFHRGWGRWSQVRLTGCREGGERDMIVWHCNLAVSLDGRIARADGSVDDWLARDYPPPEGEWSAFTAGVDAILMGRGTYDAVAGSGDWPYPGKPTVVMTSRPIERAPAEVEARDDLAAAVVEIEGRGYRRVWVEGGGELVRGMLGLGRL